MFPMIFLLIVSNLAEANRGGVTPLEESGKRNIETRCSVPDPSSVTVKDQTQSPGVSEE